MIRQSGFKRTAAAPPGGVETILWGYPVGGPGGPRGAQWATVMGQHLELASIPKHVRDWSINAYTVILKNPVTEFWAK